jgi:hypothetical protein
MTSVQIEWPDALVSQARTAELLATDARHRLLSHVVQQQAANTPAISALDSAGDLVGCFNNGPADLSSNPHHLDDFGRV